MALLEEGTLPLREIDAQPQKCKGFIVVDYGSVIRLAVVGLDVREVFALVALLYLLDHATGHRRQLLVPARTGRVGPDEQGNGDVR